MYDYDKRLSTFTDWPFTENCKCTPENVSGGPVYNGEDLFYVE